MPFKHVWHKLRLCLHEGQAHFLLDADNASYILWECKIYLQFQKKMLSKGLYFVFFWTDNRDSYD